MAEALANASEIPAGQSQSGRREWRQGWPLVVAAAAGIGLSSAPIYSIGVLIAPLNASFGWERAQIVLAQTLLSLIIAILSPLIGIALDRLGPRPLALVGTCIICASFGSLALLQGSLLFYYFAWSMVAVGIATASSAVWLKAIIDRFHTTRGFALSVGLCGTNVAGAIAPMLCAWLIASFGWRSAYLGLALYMFVTAFPLALLFFYDARGLRRRQEAAGPAEKEAPVPQAGVEVSEAIRGRNFWLLALSFLLAGGGITSFVIHFVPMLEDRGESTLLAASAVSGLAIAAIIGRVSAGYLLDRVFAAWLAAVALLLPVVACVILVYAPPAYEFALAAAILIGLSTGAEFNMIAYLTARYFGLRRYGIISGWMFAAFTVGSVIMPLGTALLAAAYSDYLIPIVLLGGCFLIAAAAMLFCTRYPDLEQAGT